MEGRSLADDTQPEPLAGEKREAPRNPAPGSPPTGPEARPDKKAERKREREREREEKEREREKEKADKLAEKAEKAAREAGAARAEEEPKREGRLARLRFSKKKDMPGGLWLKCESCSQVIFRKELEEKGRVCPSCGFHFTLP